jgi:hypothetical protein
MRSKLVKIFFVFFIVVFFGQSYSVVLGADEVGIKKVKGSELGLSEKSIKETIEDISKWILGFIAVLSILMIVVGGVWYIISAGDQDQVEDATEMVIFAVVGLVVALLGYAIVVIISGVLGAGKSGGTTSPGYDYEQPTDEDAFPA